MRSVTCLCPSLQPSLVCCLFQTVCPEQWCMRHEKALSLGNWKCCSVDCKVLEGKGPVGACSICCSCGECCIERPKGQLSVIGRICISRATFAGGSSLTAASLQGVSKRCAWLQQRHAITVLCDVTYYLTHFIWYVILSLAEANKWNHSCQPSKLKINHSADPWAQADKSFPHPMASRSLSVSNPLLSSLPWFIFQFWPGKASSTHL